MPKQASVTKEEIIDSAVRLIREKGHEALTVRKLAAYIGCSTQPVMYVFSTVKELKDAVYERADRMHTEYLLTAREGTDPILSIGLNYVRFAAEEPELFRFLFQSGGAGAPDLLSMIDSEEMLPVLSAMKEGTGLDMEKTKQVFITVALFAHGYASLIANNGLELDEDIIAKHLENAWDGAMMAAVREDKE